MACRHKSANYLSCHSLPVKVEWELFASVLVDLGFDHLALIFVAEANVDINRRREAEKVLEGREQSG